jgi:hypothetical protein
MLPFLRSTLELRARNLENSIQKHALSIQTLTFSTQTTELSVRTPELLFQSLARSTRSLELSVQTPELSTRSLELFDEDIGDADRVRIGCRAGDRVRGGEHELSDRVHLLSHGKNEVSRPVPHTRNATMVEVGHATPFLPAPIAT